jgi:hypothetical protein
MEQQRPIPGQVPVQGREFLYVEHASEDSFQQMFDDIGAFIEASVQPLPRGGLITTNAVLTLPSGESLFGLSFKGDVDRWEDGILRFAEARRLLTAKIQGSNVITRDGKTCPLSACVVRFFGGKA